MQIRSVTFLDHEFQEQLAPSPLQPVNLTPVLYFAGLGSRTLAFLVDFMLMLAACVSLRILTTSLHAFLGQTLETGNQLQLIGTFVILASYSGLWELLLGGKTPGKMLLGIQVVNHYGQPPHIGQTLIRNLARLFDVGTSGLGLLMLLKSKRQQRLGDWLAGTQVIRLPRVAGERPKNLPDLLQSWGLLELKPAPFKQEIPPELATRIRNLTRKPRKLASLHTSQADISDESRSNASGAI
jgi:uncharacterized RDD family membrane protein YckC